MAKDITMKRLNNQIKWYDSKSDQNQSWYKSLKYLELFFAGIIPVISILTISDFIIGDTGIIIAGIFGFFIVSLEGTQQVSQFQNNWTIYRSTCEALKHEKYLFLGKSKHYSKSPNPKRLLARKIEELISIEHSKWSTLHKNMPSKRT